MSFTDYIYVTVQNLKSSLQAGLNAFFDAQKDGQIAAFDRQQLRGLQSLFFCDGAYQHMK